MKYLSAEDILQIHSMIIDEIGGLHGVRDYHTILSLEDTPRQKVFGKELYPTIFLKAAVYIRNLIMSHSFIDGNKRTGMTSASVFLENNGYIITAKKGEIEKFALRVVNESLNLDIIADWLRKHSKKL